MWCLSFRSSLSPLSLQSLVPLKWRSLFKDMVGFGWDMYLMSVNVQPAAVPSLEAPKTTVDEAAPSAAAAAEDSSEDSCRSPEGSDSGNPLKKVNPVFPVTAVVMCFMYWADKNKAKASR